MLLIAASIYAIIIWPSPVECGTHYIAQPGTSGTRIVGPEDEAIVCMRFYLRLHLADSDMTSRSDTIVVSVVSSGRCYPAWRKRTDLTDPNPEAPVRIGGDDSESAKREHIVRVDRLSIGVADDLFARISAAGRNWGGIDCRDLPSSPLDSRKYCRYDVDRSPICGGREWPSDEPM
jgi:hypothetical protein